MPLVLGGSSAPAAAFSVDNSCCFNSADSAYLIRTVGTPTDQDKYTFSCWVKRGLITDGTRQVFACEPDGSNRELFFFEAVDTLKYSNNAAGAGNKSLVTDQLFRDPAAWYNVVVAYDSAQGVAANRTKLYLNGTQITGFSTEEYVAQDANSSYNTSGSVVGVGVNISSPPTSGAEGIFDGYIAEFVFCDGQALTPSSFGEFNSDSPTIWQPIDVSGLTFGDNGFYLDFEDSANLGADVSGNSNDFTETNIAAVDQCTDSPTNNFNTLNPLNETYSAFSQANTTVVGTNAGDNGGSCSNLSPAAGKWYAEVQIATIVSAYPSSGVRQINNSNFNSISNGAAGFCGYNNYEVGFNGNGDLLVNNSVSSSWGSSLSADDIVQFAVDCENGAIYIGINNTWQNSGVPTSGATKTGAATAWTPGPTFQGINFGDAGYNGSTGNWNFGNPSFTLTSAEADENGYGNFEYAPPSGYLALCTKNLGSDGG